MAMTMAEKIIARAAGKPEGHAGDIETVTLDYMMSNDGTTHLTIGMYENLKHPRIADKDKLVWIVDHNVPADSVKTAASHKKMRDFARANGIAFYEGEGVCHQIMLEKYVSPGQFIFGIPAPTARSVPSERAWVAPNISMQWSRDRAGCWCRRPCASSSAASCAPVSTRAI